MSISNNRVTNSATGSVAAVFSTVTTTANVLTSGINALGNLAEELNLRSEERLHNVRQDIAHDRIRTDATRRNDHALKLARSLKSTQEELAKDKSLEKFYKEVLTLFGTIDAKPAT